MRNEIGMRLDLLLSFGSHKFAKATTLDKKA